MSDIEIKEAITKLQSLSEQRAGKVMEFISDMAALEALEDAEDLRDALKSLKELEAEKTASTESGIPTTNTQFANTDESPTIPWETLKKELNL